TEHYRPYMSDVLRDLSRVQAARPTCHWWRCPRLLAWFRVLMVVSLVKRPASAGLLSRIGDYSIAIHRFEVGVSIPKNVAPSIAKADVLIALITELNANVIYELAIRNMLKSEVLLIVHDPESLPIYVKDFGRIDYDRVTGEILKSTMNRIVADKNIPL